VDAITGLPTSAVFRQVVDIWSGQADYLSYVQTALSLVPGGGKVASSLREASAKTKAVRAAIQRGADLATSTGDAIRAVSKEGGLVNVASQYARSRVNKQIVFYKDQAELEHVTEELTGTGLLNRAIIDR
jgi:hypothetical protein